MIQSYLHVSSCAVFFVVPSYRLPLIDNHYIDGLFLLRTPFTRSKGDAPQNYVNNHMRQAAFSWQRNAIAYAIIWRGANDIIFFFGLRLYKKVS